MNQISVIASERSSAIIQSYLFIFIAQGINALNKQFHLGWKLMNYDFKGDLQTQSINRMVKIPRTARITEHWYQNAPSHTCRLQMDAGAGFLFKKDPLKIAPHLWAHGARTDSWNVWQWSPSLGTVTRKHLTHDWGKILPWEIQELLQGSTNERRLFLYINYVFLLQTASIK